MTRAALRVLSISTLFPCPARPGFGGFVARSLEAVAALAAAGEDVELTVLNPIGVPPWPLSRSAPYKALGETPAQTSLGALAIHHPRFLTLPGLADGNPARLARAIMPLVRRLHAAQPFDLIDAQFGFPDAPAGHRIAAALGLPLLTKARGSDINYWATRPAAWSQILTAGRYAARQLAVADALGAKMAALGLPAETIRTHYTGLDHARFNTRPREEARRTLDAAYGLDLPMSAPLLASVGALVPRKGQDLAIAALANFSGGGAPRAHLAIAGAGPDEARLRALATKLRLAERVHFLGALDHQALPLLMAAADVMVLPSASEGLANVWIEALACGTPLVIADVDGAREVVRGLSAGRLAARNPAAIAEAISALLANPPAQADVAAHAAAFSWETNARELVAHWRAAIH